VGRFVVRQVVGGNQGAIQRCTLVLCALVLVLVITWGNAWENGPVLARYEQRPAAQVSPLGVPITMTTSNTITDALNAPISPLGPEVITEVTAGITSGVTVAITSVLTTATTTATIPITNAAPVVEAPPPTVDLVNRGQISLYLVGAVLTGLLLLVVVVIGRQR
jgi:hypothetical protein